VIKCLYWTVFSCGCIAFLKIKTKLSWKLQLRLKQKCRYKTHGHLLPTRGSWHWSAGSESFRYFAPYSGTNFLNHSASLITHISHSLTHSLTSLVMPSHPFQQCHHCHRLSPLLSLTPVSKHTFSTNHFHHSLPIIDHPWTDFTVTWPTHWFLLAKRGRLSRHCVGFWASSMNFYFHHRY